MSRRGRQRATERTPTLPLKPQNSPGVDTAHRHDPATGVLHLTTIDGGFDESRDVALGPHCFIGRDEALPEWRGLVFAEAFPDEPALETAEKNLRGLVNHLLPGIADRLNAYHGTSHSIDFWRIIVLPWLIELMQKAWTSYARLRLMIDQYGDRPLTVKVCQDDPEWRFRDTAHFFETMLKDYRLNWWFESEMIAAIAPANWRLQPTEPLPHPQVASPASESLRAQTPNRFRAWLRRFKYRLGYSDILGVRWIGLLLAVYANLLPKSPSQMHFEPEPNFRPETFFPRSFLEGFDRLMDATMPLSFLDGFPELAKKARRLPYRPGRLRLGALNFWNEQEKVIAAFAKEAGEKRVVFQHGGEYGMLNYNMMYNEMEARHTIFITWGWAYDEPADINGHFLPLPSPFHSKVADRHKRRNNSIIVVGGGIRIHLNRFHWWSRSEMVVRYYKDAICFLETLGDTVRKNVVFRPYARSASDIDTRKIINDRFPGIPMLENDFHGALMKCRLVVFYSFGTAMNHTMAANVPTVVYMPPDLMKPRKEAEPFFEPLRKCGVIHDSAEDVARHINRIHDDIEGWWNGPDVQKARKIWVHQFARTDRFWWWQWMKALAKLKDVG